MTDTEWAASVLGEAAKPVEGWPKIFATKTGRLFSAKGRGVELSQSTSNGYKFVMVRDAKGKSKILYAHRAVLLAWNRPPNPGEEARHINGERADNRISNLSWGTRNENAMDRAIHGTNATGLKNGAHTKPHRRRKGSKNGNSSLDEHRVQEMRHKYASGEAAARLCEEFNIGRSALLAACNGLTWRHAGGPITKRGSGRGPRCTAVREIVDD